MSRARGGFTLLETMIAAALTVAILAAVGQSIRLVYRADRTSGGDLDRALIAAALFERIASDLGALVVPAVADDATSRQVDALDPQDADPAETLGVFFGDAQSLTYQCEPPRGPWLLASEATAVADAGGPSGGVGPARRVVIWQVNDPPPGIAAVVSYAGSLDESVEISRVDVPEVVALTFGYESEGETFESWDDVEAGGPPASVVVSLEVAAAGASKTFTRRIEVPAGRFSPPSEGVE